MSALRVKCCALNSDTGIHFEILGQAGFQVETVDRDLDLWDEQSLINELSGCVASIAGSEPYTRKVMESLPDLRVIARTGVGFDAIDLSAADDHGVVVTTTPGVNHHSVAEHTIAMLMGVARGFPDNDQRVREGRWVRIERPRVMGRTLGIVGLGRIGKAVATRAIGLELKVIVHEPYPDHDFCQKWNLELVSLEELLQRSDYVSLHNPVTEESRGMMNADRFALMKPGSVFINTARGALVDEQALIDALQSGHLRAAALDVFEVEPLPLDSPLIQMSNVLLAGHLAGLDIESQRDALTMAAETIIALRDGQWPKACIQNLRNVDDWSWEK